MINKKEDMGNIDEPKHTVETSKELYVEDFFDFKVDSIKNTPKRKDTLTDYLLLAATAILVCVIIWQAYGMGMYYWDLYKNDQDNKRAEEIFDNLIIHAIKTPALSIETEDEAFEDKTEEVAVEEITKEISEEIAPSSEDAVSSDTNKLSFDSLIFSVDYLEQIITSLQAEFNNTDIIGYIIINDTNISYPIVKAADNDFYLKRNLYKKANQSGSIFMDFDNEIDFSGNNTVIYGHNMKNGSMFHDLRYYNTKDYYKNHKYITIITKTEKIDYEVFSCYPTKTDFNYIQTRFADLEEYGNLVNKMMNKSLYKTGVNISHSDDILTLSTCTSTADDMRFVVHAKRLHTSRSE